MTIISMPPPSAADACRLRRHLLLRSEGLREVLTNDEHFEQEGFTRVLEG